MSLVSLLCGSLAHLNRLEGHSPMNAAQNSGLQRTPYPHPKACLGFQNKPLVREIASVSLPLGLGLGSRGPQRKHHLALKQTCSRKGVDSSEAPAELSPRGEGVPVTQSRYPLCLALQGLSECHPLGWRWSQTHHPLTPDSLREPRSPTGQL